MLFLFYIILLRISKQRGQINDLPKVEVIHDGYQIKSRKSNTCSVKELIVDGVSITNPTDLPDTFNEHFSTVGPELANEIPSAANSNKGVLLISIYRPEASF